ncbi:MAG: tetratricopeptide repeat protein, partial [Anaerolineae bacterium]|nr:tetratricopeptide repeat protein [Thermoflexales bacterium]MDW8408275.1 tetratricopeptide repeat protein [Anaerolineae bacterium]
QHTPDSLAMPIADLPARHHSLHAVFESAWEALSETGRQALAALSVLRAPCPRPAALHLAGGSAALNALIEQSLVHQLADGSIWMHETTRRFAAAQLRAGADGPARESEARRRHAEWFLDWLAESRAALRSAQSVERREHLIASFDDLDAAWEWALSHHMWLWLSRAVFEYETLYRLAGRLADGVEHLTRALASLRSLNDDATRRLRARLLIACDTSQSLRTNLPQTEKHLREAAELAEQIGDPALSLQAWSRLARELRSHGNDQTHQAREALERARAALSSLDEQQADPDALSAQLEYWRQLGAFDYQRGHWEDAERHMRTALSLARRAQDDLVVAKVMEHLSTVLAARGLGKEADHLLDQALEIYQRLRLTYQQTNVLDLLAQRADARGDYAQAQQHYLKAIELAQASGNRNAEMVTRINLGISCDQMGDYAQALAHTQAALALCREFGAADHLATVLANLSLHAHHNGEHALALGYAREATETAQRIQMPDIEAYGWEFQGHAQLALGDTEAAETAYRRALEIRQTLKQAILVFETRAGLARVALARGDIRSAAAWVEPVAAHLLNGGNLDGAEETLRVYWTTHQVLAHNDDPRAVPILHLASCLIEERAARLSNPHSCMAYMNIEVHRRILNANQHSVRLQSNPQLSCAE